MYWRVWLHVDLFYDSDSSCKAAKRRGICAELLCQTSISFMLHSSPARSIARSFIIYFRIIIEPFYDWGVSGFIKRSDAYALKNNSSKAKMRTNQPNEKNGSTATRRDLRYFGHEQHGRFIPDRNSREPEHVSH